MAPRNWIEGGVSGGGAIGSFRFASSAHDDIERANTGTSKRTAAVFTAGLCQCPAGKATESSPASGVKLGNENRHRAARERCLL